MKTPRILPFAAGVLLCSAACLPNFVPRADAQTSGFASQVVDYTPGTGISTTYQNSASALGKPGGSPGGATLNPFSPNYAGSELTGIGVGGQLTLSLSNFVTVGPAGTREIGFYGNVGLIDTANNNPPTAGNPATVFGLRSVLISVSADGVNFIPLNGGALITSTLPANYYTNPDTSNYSAAPPANPSFADFGKPFAGTLADFNGQTYAQTLTTLNGSAGGTWLDLSGTGLAQVGYVRFSEPSTGGQNGGVFYLNGVSSNTALLGLAVPEPGAVVFCVVGALALAWGVRRRAGRLVTIVATVALLSGVGRAGAQMFSFSDIKNWTGTGANQAAVVIDWHDGKTPESIAWGYRWDGAATGLQMIQAIDAADPRLSVAYAYSGTFVFGIGYDLNNNGGTFTFTTPGDETGSASDPDDHFAEGVFTKFWGYDVSQGSPYGGGGTWAESSVGSSSRQLTNGSWDAYSLSYDEANFSIPDPGFPTAAAGVPEPSSSLLAGVALAAALGIAVRRRVSKLVQG